MGIVRGLLGFACRKLRRYHAPLPMFLSHFLSIFTQSFTFFSILPYPSHALILTFYPAPQDYGITDQAGSVQLDMLFVHEEVSPRPHEPSAYLDTFNKASQAALLKEVSWFDNRKILLGQWAVGVQIPVVWPLTGFAIFCLCCQCATRHSRSFQTPHLTPACVDLPSLPWPPTPLPQT